MVFSIETWFLPAIGAAASSYLVSLGWERLRHGSAPSGFTSAFLSALSFIMGAICSYYRAGIFGASLENNIIVMFIVSASTTYFWLRLRKYFLRLGIRDRR